MPIAPRGSNRLLKKSSRAVSALNRRIAAHAKPFVFSSERAALSTPARGGASREGIVSPW